MENREQGYEEKDRADAENALVFVKSTFAAMAEERERGLRQIRWLLILFGIFTLVSVILLLLS